MTLRPSTLYQVYIYTASPSDYCQIGVRTLLLSLLLHCYSLMPHVISVKEADLQEFNHSDHTTMRILTSVAELTCLSPARSYPVYANQYYPGCYSDNTGECKLLHAIDTELVEGGPAFRHVCLWGESNSQPHWFPEHLNGNILFVC